MFIFSPDSSDQGRLVRVEPPAVRADGPAGGRDRAGGRGLPVQDAARQDDAGGCPWVGRGVVTAESDFQKISKFEHYYMMSDQMASMKIFFYVSCLVNSVDDGTLFRTLMFNAI